ncbi:MAG: hypothetical protein ACFE8F_12045 [Promethearchaeota archaeon]
MFFSKEGKTVVVMARQKSVQSVIEMKGSIQSKYNIKPFVTQLHLSATTQDRAEAILSDAERMCLTSKKAPESLMAAALYIACILEGERRTQKTIGQVIDVSPHTIQRCYRQLVHVLEIRSG